MKREERLYLVRKLVDLGLPKVFRYPGMKEELQDYVASGEVEAIREKRLRGLMINLQARQLKKLDDKRIRDIMMDTLMPTPAGDEPALMMDAAPRKKRRKRGKGGRGLTPTLTMGLLLYGFIGIVAILFLTQSPGYWQTETGRAISTTFLIMSISVAVLWTVRNRARSLLELIAMIVLTVLVGGGVYLAINSGTIDLNLLADEVAANPDRALGYGLIGFALLIGFMLLVLRKILSTVLSLILLILLVLLVLLAFRFGIVDFNNLF